MKGHGRTSSNVAARAASLVYEPFAYAGGTVLDGVTATGQNLTGTYEPFAITPTPKQTLTVGSPGLDYGNLGGVPSAAGNKVGDKFGGVAAWATVAVDQDVSTAPGETVYWSALFTFDDSQDASHLANIQLSDADTGGSISFGQSSLGSRRLQLGVDTSTTFLTDGVESGFSDGDTLFYVGRYFNSASADGDTLDLIIYDTADSILLPTSFDPTDPNAKAVLGLSNLDIDLTKISSIAFAIRGLDDNFVDELRIGTTYSSVVPEPSTALLFGLGLVGLAPLRRRCA